MCLIEKSNKRRLIEHPLNALRRTPADSSSCKWPKWRDANGKTNGMEGGEGAVTPIRHSRNLPTRWRDVEEGTGQEKDSCGFICSCQENSGGAVKSATQAWAIQLAWELFAVVSALWAWMFMSTDDRAKTSRNCRWIHLDPIAIKP